MAIEEKYRHFFLSAALPVKFIATNRQINTALLTIVCQNSDSSVVNTIITDFIEHMNKCKQEYWIFWQLHRQVESNPL